MVHHFASLIYFCAILFSTFLVSGCVQAKATPAVWVKSMTATKKESDRSIVARNKKIPVEIGIASYYANCLDGKATACGDLYCANKLTAAHKTLPLGTIVRVSMLSTGKEVVVVVNDRGPYSKNRMIDLSFKAAHEIGLIRAGVAKVKLEVVSSVK